MPAVRQVHRTVTNYENHGNYRWSKPPFQAFQLRPQSQDPDAEEAIHNSLAIFGPQVQNEISRAKSVPAREKDTVSRLDVRTAHSVAHARDLISLKPKSSIEAMPVRPPLSKTKQIPGRYFPKPTTSETTKVVSFSMFRRYKPPVRPRVLNVGNSRSLDTSNLPLESVSFRDTLPRSNTQPSPSFGRRMHRPWRQSTEFPDIKSEVFAICFNAGNGTKLVPATDSDAVSLGGSGARTVHTSYDPTSELHSDYYTIKRVSVKSNSSKFTPPRSFSVVLRGQTKRLHPKLLLLSSESEAGTDAKSDSKSSTSSCARPHSTDKGKNFQSYHNKDSHEGDDRNFSGIQSESNRGHRKETAVTQPPTSGRIQVKIDSGQLQNPLAEVS